MPELNDASASVASGVDTSTAGSSPADTSSTSSAPSEQSASTASAVDVQGTSQPTTDTDPMAGLLSMEELNAIPDGIQHKKSLVQMRMALDALNPKLTELQTKYQTIEPYQEYLQRFERPEQLQEIVNFREKLNGWEKDPQTGEMVPATQSLVKELNTTNRVRADYLAADLINSETVDPDTGRTLPRIDLALEAMAKDPARRQKALSILGGVEPSSIAPQWQPSQDELDAIPRDLANITPEEKSLQDEYRRLPYDKREQLKVSDPEFVRDYLADQKFKRETRERDSQREADTIRNREQYQQHVGQQAQAAGDNHVRSMMSEALTTFHNSVVEQCNFLQPLDPASLPQGMTPEQATQMNQQIAESNKAEAAQITLAVVGLINEETRPFVLPLLKEIGVIDDKMLSQLDAAASAFGDNARNYGHLNYRGQLQANGNGYQPGQDVTQLNNEAQRNLKLMAHYANQIKGKLMEKRSQFFSMKATGHNQTLNSASVARPSPNGSTFNPATAAAPQPQGFLTRQQINQQFGG